VAGDEFAVLQLSLLFKRLAIAETLQWRLRRKPLGIEDWRLLAGEDTGTMFEACACLASRSEQLRRFGRLLGMVYHGCDDVGDVRDSVGLGGGGAQDIRDGILTLPAAIAIRDPQVALEFGSPTRDGAAHLLDAMQRALPEAESYLNQIAAEAEAEAMRLARKPEVLIALVRQTRGLSA
jgi:geranylgeranyl pyrophosphate synthase